MEHKFNEYNNFENERNHMEQGNSSADVAGSRPEQAEAVNSSVEPASTGAPGSVYSYSYLNQENQDRNPNYFEKKEEENANGQRTYTTGSYGTFQEENQMDPQGYTQNQTSNQGAEQGYTGNQGGTQNYGNQGYPAGRGYEGSQGTEGCPAGESRQNFYKTPEASAVPENTPGSGDGDKEE